MILTWDLGPPPSSEVAPMLAEQLRSGMDRVEAQWGDLCREIGSRHQLPDGWLQAMIWRESGGNARAFRQEKDRFGVPIRDAFGRLLTGVGLMQITSPAIKKNRTDAELFNPPLNVELGATYVSYLASRPDVRGTDGKPDFARISAAFNAGSVRDSGQNRWGMVQTSGHVDAEVAAFNYWLSRRMSDAQREAALAIAVQFTPTDLQETLESDRVTLADAEDGEPAA
jgi:soluble lytic murein transglycosylase-like protein